MTDNMDMKFQVDKEVKSELIQEYSLFNTGLGLIVVRQPEIINFFPDSQKIKWEKNFRAYGGLSLIFYRTEHYYRFEVLIMADHLQPKDPATPGEISRAIVDSLKQLVKAFLDTKGPDIRERLLGAVSSLTGLTFEEIEREEEMSEGAPLRGFFSDIDPEGKQFNEIW